MRPSDLPKRTPTQRRTANRDHLEAEILAQATRAFSEYGYEGTSLATIADSVGLSKQNLLYYFPNKRALYIRVLDDVLDEWLERMRVLADPDSTPEEALRAYIAAKLKFSRDNPWGSRVYGMEVITGAKTYGKEIKEKVVPLLRQDIEVFEKWIAEGRIAPVNATHLLFTIWAMTQSYADFAIQMSLVLDQKKLAKSEYEAAEALITSMVLGVIARRD
jgi:TetR/AcrR family transcriptional regulator